MKEKYVIKQIDNAVECLQNACGRIGPLVREKDTKEIAQITIMEIAKAAMILCDLTNAMRGVKVKPVNWINVSAVEEYQEMIGNPP